MQEHKKASEQSELCSDVVEEGGFEPPKLTQQIYSLPPLATRELLHMELWSWWTDSNPRPADYKSAALPAELHQRIKSAVQQQVLFYQRTYTLSSVIFKFKKIFSQGRRECSYTAVGLRQPLLLPLRDVQQAPPAAYCPRCGGEQYRWDRMVWRAGRRICAECAAREEEEEKNEP